MKFKLIVSGTAVVMLLAVAWPAAGQDPSAGGPGAAPAESQAERKEPEGETQATQEAKAKSKSKKESKKQSEEDWGFRWADHPSLHLGQVRASTSGCGCRAICRLGRAATDDDGERSRN